MWWKLLRLAAAPEQFAIPSQGEKKKFKLPKSNVFQFHMDKVDQHGVWSSIVRGIPLPKFSDLDAPMNRVSKLKKKLWKLLKNWTLWSSKINWDAIEITLLYSDPTNPDKLDPNTNYEIKGDISLHDLAWAAHLPINSCDGSYMYIWPGTGCRMAVHIKVGQCLLLYIAVVHSGSLPKAADEKARIILDYISTYQQTASYLLSTTP